MSQKLQSPDLDAYLRLAGQKHTQAFLFLTHTLFFQNYSLQLTIQSH